MGTLHRLPTSKPDVFDPPKTGYCVECGHEMEWPRLYDWPDTCPQGCSPLVMTSWRPQGASVHVIRDGTGRIVGTIPA
jgi:hypothetical protein